MTDGYKVKRVYLGGPTTVEVSDMQGPCPDGFHVPLKSEFDDLVSIGNSLGAWNSNDNAKIYLKMPSPGFIKGIDGTIGNRTLAGSYISSTKNTNSREIYGFLVGKGKVYGSLMGNDGRNIRPFKDTPVVPDSNWTVLYQGTGTAGIYHNPTLGLISLSSNGTKRITMADKNLGATTVYNDGDTLSESNCGYYYKRGNNYGFSFTGPTTTSTTQVNASTYGPGNYYNSSSFYIDSTQKTFRDSSDNKNLRGGTTQGTSTKTVYNKVRPKE